LHLIVYSSQAKLLVRKELTPGPGRSAVFEAILPGDRQPAFIGPKQLEITPTSRHQKWRELPLANHTGGYHYHTLGLPPNDVQIFDEVLEQLKDARYLKLPQALEPFKSTAAIIALVGLGRSAGLGSKTDDAAGPFFCLIRGQTRPDRKPQRTLEHIRVRFEHCP
jgi:hypothetical protein